MKLLALLILTFASVVPAAATSMRVPDSSLIVGHTGDDAVKKGFNEAVNALAVTIAVECYPEDLECAGYVAATILYRRIQASTERVQITVKEIVETPKQFSGLKYSPLLKDPVKLSIGTDYFKEIAAAAINGKLDGKYPVITHYARKEALKRTAWGRAAIEAGGIIYTPDGHGFVPGNLPFVLPRRAENSNKRASWSRCVKENPSVMAHLFPDENIELPRISRIASAH